MGSTPMLVFESRLLFQDLRYTVFARTRLRECRIALYIFARFTEGAVLRILTVLTLTQIGSEEQKHDPFRAYLFFLPRDSTIYAKRDNNCDSYSVVPCMCIIFSTGAVLLQDCSRSYLVF